MRQVRALCVVIASVFTPALVAEFQVNTQATYDQTDAAIAMDADGDFLIVWSSYHQDGDSGGIFGRRFDPNCREVGGEFQINTETVGNQTEPTIVMHEAGSFVVAWHGPGTGEQDIYARRFNAQVEPLGGEFRVNGVTEGRQRFPRAAMSRTGTFVVVWESEKPVAETYAWTAAGQLYDANGALIGNEFQASQLQDCRYPDAAMDAHGNFVVVWLQDRSTNSIMGRLYDAEGRPRTEAFAVSSIGFSSVTRPSVAMDNGGNFVVTWDGHSQSAGMDDIHARWFRSDGTALSEQFVVNTTIDRAQQNPRISMTGQGEFVIVWNSESEVEGAARDVFAQRFNASCLPVGYELRLNGFTANDQKYPAAAIARSAKFVAAWQSDGQDGSGYGIFATTNARVCPTDLFDDGFVDFLDYCVFAAEWLTEGDSLAADLVEDNIVNPRDLAEFCRDWLMPCQRCSLAP